MSALAFTSPALLWALGALPLVWWLLRAVPPAPVRRRFPGVILLQGLDDRETEAERTPWWLLALRMAALALAILGFAGPVLNRVPVSPIAGPLLIVADTSWAEAPDWARRSGRIGAALSQAEAAGRPVALLSLTRPEAVSFGPAATLRAALPGLQPQPFEPGAALPPLPEGRFETLWLSDGLAREGRAELLAALQARGPITVAEAPGGALGLTPPRLTETGVALEVLRSRAETAALVEVVAEGRDPSGQPGEIARLGVSFAPGQARAEASFALPPELRNRLTRFTLAGAASAGGVALADDGMRRRKVAILAPDAAQESLALMLPTHYLTQALAPTADLISGTLSEVITASPDVIILADYGQITERAALEAWVDAGGLLIRFAGPRLAAVAGGDDALLPVRLREGGRSVGGALSWGAPRKLAPFPEASPFAGLAVPDEISVRGQVLAEPGPELADATLAALEDGTPLVTRAARGQGQVVLVHVTANADWSSLPLSGLFPEMLARLIGTARGTLAEGDLAGLWVPEQALDGFGQLSPASGAGVEGAALAQARATGPSAALLPGLYAGQGRSVALNTVAPGRSLAPAVWPATVTLEQGSAAPERSLAPLALALALGLLLLDILAALALGGKLRRGLAVLLALAFLAPPQARAQDETAIARASEVVLAHVLTGDTALDAQAQAGLEGLSGVLYDRTTVEPASPAGVDPETDDLSLLTFLYWPITADTPQPSLAAYTRLNRFLRGGGLILFDTRDADVAGAGASTPEGQALQRIAAGLEIPPLEPVPPDHVLTRSFYLLQSFPGRFAEGTIWVEAAPPEAAQADGVPFRSLNDGVTPVVIGGGDWAAAWAVDSRGLPVNAVGRGQAGEQQREMAYRFGVNLVMHVLTGNYKSDQVHVPALLERLGSE